MLCVVNHLNNEILPKANSDASAGELKLIPELVRRSLQQPIEHGAPAFPAAERHDRIEEPLCLPQRLSASHADHPGRGW